MAQIDGWAISIADTKKPGDLKEVVRDAKKVAKAEKATAAKKETTEK